MRLLYIKSLQLFLLIITSLVVSVSSIQASTYGSGQYGAGIYSGSATPTPQSNSSSSSSGGGGGGQTVCTTISPIFSPDLFQVNSLSTQATLYFAPISGSYTGYIFDYGYDTRTDQFSTSLSINSSQGALKYTINYLNPNTTYSFKISAQNGCTSGPWSNTITIKTSPKGSTRQSITYKGSVMIINNAVQISQNGKPVVSIPIPFTAQPTPSSSNNYVVPQGGSTPSKINTSQPVYVPPSQPKSSGNWFSNTISAIKNFFGF